MRHPAKTYNAVQIHQPHYAVTVAGQKAIREYASRYLHGRLLDIGCGNKSKEALVGRYVEEYIGIDHPGTQHNTARLDLFGTAYEIPVTGNSFDSVLCTTVLEHLEEPAAAIREAFRVLKPNGYALYTVPLFWHLHEEPRDFYRYTKHGLAYLFQGAGFTVTKIVPVSGFLTTFSTEWNYYLRRFRRGLFKPVIDGLTAASNLTLPNFDRSILRDEKFTWMYLIIAQKPSVTIDRVQTPAHGTTASGVPA